MRPSRVQCGGGSATGSQQSSAVIQPPMTRARIGAGVGFPAFEYSFTLRRPVPIHSDTELVARTDHLPVRHFQIEQFFALNLAAVLIP